MPTYYVGIFFAFIPRWNVIFPVVMYYVMPCTSVVYIHVDMVGPFIPQSQSSLRQCTQKKYVKLHGSFRILFLLGGRVDHHGHFYGIRH